MWKFIRDGRLDIVRVAGIKRTLIIYDSLFICSPQLIPLSQSHANAVGRVRLSMQLDARYECEASKHRSGSRHPRLP
jgi:hypothetical protein